MSIKPDDLTVTQIGGDILTEAMLDATTPFGLLVQLRGVDATAASATCTVKRGSASVSLTTTLASGSVTTSITAANMTTLGAARMDALIAQWVVTVTDGADSHVTRREQVLGVGDSIIRFPLDYAELAAEVPQMTKPCAIPSGQTNFWEQVRLGLTDLRDDINRRQGGVKTYVMSRPGELRQLARAYALVYVLQAMIVQSNASRGWFHDLRAEKVGLKKTLWHAIAVTVKESSETWGNDTGGGRVAVTLEPVATWGGGPAAGSGGPW